MTVANEPPANNGNGQTNNEPASDLASQSVEPQAEGTQTASAEVLDPIRDGARIVAGADSASLERRLKTDIFNSMCRIKPELKAHDFESEIMSGSLLPTLPAPLQGIAIARVEGALAFYNRVGWHPQFLEDRLESCLQEGEELNVLKQRYHASTMHDLSYVHPKHFEKIFGKTGAAKLWEDLKRYHEKLGPQDRG